MIMVVIVPVVSSLVVMYNYVQLIPGFKHLIILLTIIVLTKCY